MNPNASVRSKLAPLFAFKAVLGLYLIIGALAYLAIGCSTDAQFDIEKVEVDEPEVCVDVENCDQDDDDNGNGNGGDDDDGDDDDDDGDTENPAQTDCTTIELGNYVSDNVILGKRFKKDCSPEFTKIFVKKNNGDKQTLEFTRFQDVMIGSSTINCVKLFKRWNIDGVLLEKLEYDTSCNLK